MLILPISPTNRDISIPSERKQLQRAINQAKVDVAEQEKLGAIGEAEATKVKEIRVAENVAESEKGKKKAEADQRVFVQQQEAEATIGETAANRDQEIKVAENVAESAKGQKKAEADRRIFVHQQEALAVDGENRAKADIADTTCRTGGETSSCPETRRGGTTRG